MQLLTTVVAAVMVLNPFSAASKSTPTLTITASGSTYIGLQIFANSNLFGGTNATGSLTFRLYGPGDTSCASAIFTSTVPVTGTSMNSAHYTTTSAGTYRWTSSYGGDANNSLAGPTSCSDPSAAVIVQGALTGVSVTGPAPAGGSIHGLATLTGGVSPTGAITFYLTGPDDKFCSQTIFTSTVAAHGNGTYPSGLYTPMVTGTFRWRVAYTGDGNNQGDPVTSCLDPNDSVNVASVTQPAAASVAPSSVVFATATVGSTSAPQTVTVTNTGGANLSIATVTKTGSAAADFVIGGDQCSGATVVPNGTCTVAVFFAPTATGGRRATLTVNDDAAASPQPVALAGQGAPDRGLLTYPLDGQTAVDTTRNFTWAPASLAQGYYLVVGTTQYGKDLVNSGVLPPGQTFLGVPALPTGRTLYATLLTETNGSWTRYQAISFTAAPGLATFTSPLNGATKLGASTVFRWSTIPAGQAYYLVVGAQPYGAHVVNSGVLPANQSSYSGAPLPAGRTLYATLYTETNGSWTRYQAITFTTG